MIPSPKAETRILDDDIVRLGRGRHMFEWLSRKFHIHEPP